MQQYDNLPVPVSPPNQQAMQGMQNLPFNPPFSVPVQIAPQLNQFVPFVTGSVLMELMQNCQKNPLRSFFFNLISNNNWQNNEFPQLCQRVANMAEFFVFTKNMPPQQAIPQAAAEACLTMMAQVTFQLQGQGLNRYITQELAANLNDAIQRGQAWDQELQRFGQMQQQQQQMQQTQQYGQNYGNQAPMNPNAPAWMNSGPSISGGHPSVTGGYPPPAYGNRGGGGGGAMGIPGYSGSPGYNQGPVPGHGGGFNPNAVANRGRGGGMGMFTGGQSNQGPENTTTMHSGMKPRVRKTDNMVLTMGPDGDRKLEVWNSQDVAEQEQITSAQRRVTPNNDRAFGFTPPGDKQDQFNIDQFPMDQTIQPAEQETWPKLVNPERPYDGMIFEDGSELRPAYKSEWNVTFTVENPYRTIYDPTQFVLFHFRRPDGTVTERLEPRTEEMDYMKHELNPRLREQARVQNEANEPEVVPQWNLAAKLRSMPNKPDFAAIQAAEDAEADAAAEAAAATADDLETPAATPIENVTPVHARKEAELKLMMFSRSPDVKADTPVEFRFEVIHPLITNHNLINTLKVLEKATTYEELLAKLYDVDKKLETDEVRQFIDKRITDSINEALQRNFSLSDWSIDSFKEDYNDLVTALKERYGDVLIGIFADSASEVIGRALSVLSGEAYSTYLKTLDGGIGGDDSGCVLAFRDRSSITQVPWNFADLKLDLNGGGLIPPAAMPELYEAVAAIFARTEDWPVTFAYRYLQTADKKLIELRRGYLGNDAFLMFEAK